MNVLPGKTIERLSQYRRVLLEYNHEGKQFIYSHQLASLLHITPVQVRRDLMLIGYNCTLKKGYHINELINQISSIIDPDEIQKIVVIGLGNLGRAFIKYLNGKRTKLVISASFDIDIQKINKIICGITCYHIDRLSEIFHKENFSLAILTVPADQASLVAQKLVDAGIKGILNFTSASLNMSPDVYFEEYDIITSLEKTAYFARKNNMHS